MIRGEKGGEEENEDGGEEEKKRKKKEKERHANTRTREFKERGGTTGRGRSVNRVYRVYRVWEEF